MINMKLLCIVPYAFLLAAGAYAIVTMQKFGDVDIRINGTFWNCDKIVCPEETELCQVYRRLDKENRTMVHRRNECLDVHNNTLVEQTFNEDLNSTLGGHLTMYMYKNGDAETDNNPLFEED